MIPGIAGPGLVLEVVIFEFKSLLDCLHGFSVLFILSSKHSLHFEVVCNAFILESSDFD